MTIVNMVGGGGSGEIRLAAVPTYAKITTTASYTNFSGYTAYVYMSKAIAVATVGSDIIVKSDPNTWQMQVSSPYCKNASITEVNSSIASLLSGAGVPAGNYTMTVSSYANSTSGKYTTFTFDFDGNSISNSTLSTTLLAVEGLIRGNAGQYVGITSLTYNG